MRAKGRKIHQFLRMMSKKGFYDVLLYVENQGEVHYNDVRRYAQVEKGIVESRAWITTIMNGLTEMGLLERKVEDTRPMRTTYRVTEKGKSVLKYLASIEKEIENSSHTLSE